MRAMRWVEVDEPWGTLEGEAKRDQADRGRTDTHIIITDIHSP
jgi:hypothetical protein